MLSTRGTPVMGWNSWNALRCNGVDESTLLDIADRLVGSGLRDQGYDHFVVDDCWQATSRDARGRLVPHPHRFGHGMPWLADQLHQRGLRLGLYLSPGCRTCAQIYDGYGDGSGLGSFGRMDQDLSTLLDWGVDFLKFDWCQAGRGGTGLRRRQTFLAMSELVAAADREIVLSVSDYGLSRPWRWAPGHANLWRTTPDVGAHWRDVLWSARFTSRVASASRAGSFADPDMLQVGNGALVGPPGWAHLAMWAMLAAPLMIGTDLRTATPATVATLAEPVLIALDQDPLARPGRLVAQRPGLDVWRRDTSVGPIVLIVNTQRVRRRVDLDRWHPSPGEPYAVTTFDGSGDWTSSCMLAPRSAVLLHPMPGAVSP